MQKLIKLIQLETKQSIEKFATQIINEENEALNNWQYKNLLPKNSKKVFNNPTEKKYYLLERYKKDKFKSEAKQVEKITTIFNTVNIIDSINISVEWKKSRMWGANPTAYVRVNFKGGECKNFESGSIGGCGYDKESTAISEALNYCNELLKLMYTKKDKKTKLNNGDIFGYGSGYGLLPYFNGGVGVSCYYQIFESLGFKFEKVSSGKTFDVYRATNKKLK